MSDIIQGSEAWRMERCGKATASRVSDIMAKRKDGKPSASRMNYMAELIAERLTGNPTEHFVSAAMAHGTEQEAAARAAYAMLYEPVTEVGFIPHPVIADSGASPDGLVGDHGLIEIKAPNTATHIDTLLTGSGAGDYADQMQFQLACTGRQWVDFVSYDPRLPGSMQLHVTRIKRDGERISAIETEVALFLSELDAKVAALRERYDERAAA